MFHSDAGGTADTRPLRCRDMAPGHRTARAHAKGLSTLNSMAFGLAVYASQCGLPRPTQNSLPATGQALPDGLSTRKVPMKGFGSASYISSSLPKLSWRNRRNRSTHAWRGVLVIRVHRDNKRPEIQGFIDALTHSASSFFLTS